MINLNDPNLDLIELCQKDDLPDEVLDFLIAKQDEKIINLLVRNRNIEFSESQIRDIIEFMPSKNIDLLKNHHSYIKFLNNSFCKDVEDFKIHTEHHINNVIDLSLDILDFILRNEEYKTYFKINKYDENYLRKFIYGGIKLHDKAKICSEEEFLNKYELDTPLYRLLYKYYGRGFNDELKEVVEKLNTIDNNIIEEYLDEKTNDSHLRQFFKTIERLADCVERGCNRVTPEEMKKDPMLPSEFLKEELKEKPIEMNIIKFMEKKYQIGYNSSFE